MKLVVFLSDFGEKEYYVGTVKGVIKSICPEVEILDLTHGIVSHFVPSASFVLEKNYNYFPEWTLFLAVVDPGVGTDRQILFLTYDKYYFIAPDNGLLTPFLIKEEKSVRVLNQSHYFLTVKKSTFDARDKMAPVAGYFMKGVSVERLGDLAENYIINENYFPKFISESKIEGRIVYVDKFGNVITNISGEMIFKTMAEKGFKGFKLVGKDFEIREYYQLYSQGKESPFLLVGSHGNLEIAMNKKSAQKYLKVPLNLKISVEFY